MACGMVSSTPHLRKVPQANYVDMQPKNLSTTILMWCDECNDLMWPGEGGASEFMGAGDDTGSTSTWVSAANTIETINRDALSSSTASFYNHDVEVGIEGALVHVGNSSFRGKFSLYRLNEDGSAGALVAEVTSVGVHVERESLSPTPLRRRKELMQHCVPQPQPAVPQLSERPKEAYVWKTAVKQTECDDLGHLNNTRYAAYGEDALGFAVHHGAFSNRPGVLALAQQPPCSVHISYIHEVKPFEPLFCAVWYDSEQRAFIVEMRSGEDGADADGGTLAAIVVLGVDAIVPAPSPAGKQSPRL